MYDLQEDPQEWSNLAAAADPEAKAAMKPLGDVMPKVFAKAVARSKGKYKKATEIDRTIKGTRGVSKLK
ncbi:MAG: hypothetical protein P8K08_00090 [Fuerstiella sp.]|nr:hypothetical protein [Fuerstiella sp.]